MSYHIKRDVREKGHNVMSSLEKCYIKELRQATACKEGCFGAKGDPDKGRGILTIVEPYTGVSP